MAVSDIKKYYEQVENDYVTMMHELKDLEKEYNEGLITPEQYDNMKKMIDPLLSNYKTLSYVMFLLNMPVKRSKDRLKRYQGQNKKLLNHSKSKEQVLNENQIVLKELRTKSFLK